MLLVVFEQVFLPMGEVWMLHNAGTQFTVRKRGQRAEKKFYVKIVLVMPQNMSFISQL